MVIGNGLIAKNCHFIDVENVLFFASGVSNSMCEEDKEYDKEINLLKTYIDTDKKLIYFSSVDEYIINEKYLKHKKNIEEIIKSNKNDFIIMKIPQLVGKGGNSKNFIKHIYNNIKTDVEFDVFLTKRSLLDVDDLVKILKFLIDIDFKGIFTINYIELMSVTDLIKLVEKFLNKKAKIKKIVTINQNINKNTDFVNQTLENLIGKTNSYNLKVIKKYFN